MRSSSIFSCSVALFLLPLFLNPMLYAQVATLVNYFDAYYGGILRSTDPAGITYDGRYLLVVDSEINESGPPPTGYFEGYNTFEVSLDGSTVYNQYLTTPKNSSLEPTGICFSAADDFYYITNDNTMRLYQYALLDSLVLLNSWSLKDAPFDDEGLMIEDPEGVCANPITGHLYIVDGEEETGGGRRITTVEIIDGEIFILGNFSVLDRMVDPEGIAFHENSGHLFIVSSPDRKIFEYDTEGNYISDHDLSGIVPPVFAPQGLTFAPNSLNGERLSLYIADGGKDSHPDGSRIYEVDLGDHIALSAELFSFRAYQTDDGVLLAWKSLNEYDDLIWLVERSEDDGETFSEFYRINGLKQSVQEMKYELLDGDVRFGKSYHYRLSDIHPLGKITEHQTLIFEISPPEAYYLSQNFPNPFNPATKIIFTLPSPGHVSIEVFDVRGQKVGVILDKYMDAGEHEVSFAGKNLASGLYFYRLRTANYESTKRMVLLR